MPSERSRSTASPWGCGRRPRCATTPTPDGFVEPHLWTGIGRARSGCGAAIVGDPQQVAAKIRAYQALGIDTFILSGYPHLHGVRTFRLARHAATARRVTRNVAG